MTELGYVNSGTKDVRMHPVASYFFDARKRHDPLGFEAVLKDQALNDTQSTELVHLMMAHVVTLVRTASGEQHERVTRALQFLNDALKRPPQSGSADLFWKYLFLHFPELV